MADGGGRDKWRELGNEEKWATIRPSVGPPTNRALRRIDFWARIATALSETFASPVPLFVFIFDFPEAASLTRLAA